MFRCPECPFLAKAKSELKKHTNIAHAKKNNCQFCGKSFVSPSKLKTHVSSVHEKKERLPMWHLSEKLLSARTSQKACFFSP